MSKWRSLTWVAGLGAVLASVPLAHGGAFTPLEWQRRVRSGVLEGQRKHTSWIRDLDVNFVDDEIDAMDPGDKVDVFVQLNECLGAERTRAMLAAHGVLPQGRIRHFGKLLSYVIVKDAPVGALAQLAKDPGVSGIEMVREMHHMLDTSTRSIRVRGSNTYAFENVQDEFPGVDGSGVNIAIMDSGVDDDGPGSVGTTHDAFNGRFVAGFSAVNWFDSDMNGVDDSCEGLDAGVCEPGDGTTNPDDAQGHGTHVAGIALGAGVYGGGCRSADDGSTPNDGQGVAPAAGLVDVQWASGSSASSDNVAICLEWLGGHVGSPPPPGGWADVVNMSLGNNYMADGSDTITGLINALTADGMVFAVAAGNGGGNCIGDVAVAPLAITVAASDDQVTVDRDDDDISEFSTFGPALGFACGTPFDIGRAKPDITAPGNGADSTSPHACTNVGSGTGICSASKDSIAGSANKLGTSMAAPHVAGALALLLQVDGTVPPGALKDLLKVSSYENPAKLADGLMCPANNSRYNEHWGYGMLDVFEALRLRQEGIADVSFTACAGPNPSWPDQRRCQLSGGMPSYANEVDIQFATSPVEGEPNSLTIMVENRSGTEASHVTVSCGVYHYTGGIGLHDGYQVGSQIVNLPALSSVAVTFPWIPEAGDHQCAIASVDYGFDFDYTNNYTQRNLSVAPAASPAMRSFRIQNTTGQVAQIRTLIHQNPNQPQWTFDLNIPTHFEMQPDDCPVMAQITMYPPPGAPVGTTQDFDIQVLAQTAAGNEPVELGGVVVQAIVVAPGLERVYTVARHDKEGLINVKLKMAGVPESDPRREVDEMLAVFLVPLHAADGSLGPDDVQITAIGSSQVPGYTVDFLDGGETGQQLQILFDEPLADQERYRVQFTGLVDTDGDPLTGESDFDVRVLAGDANGSGTVTGTDISAIRGQINQAASFGATSRADVNLTGAVTGADISFARARMGHSAP